MRIGTTAGGQAANHFLTLTEEGTFDAGIDISFRASHPTRIYSDPGSIVSILVSRNGTSGTAFGNASLSGHLVTLP